MKRLLFLFSIALSITAVAIFVTQNPTTASSHREAPLISNDPLADNTDLYAFVTPDNSNTVTIVAYPSFITKER